MNCDGGDPERLPLRSLRSVLLLTVAEPFGPHTVVAEDEPDEETAADGTWPWLLLLINATRTAWWETRQRRHYCEAVILKRPMRTTAERRVRQLSGRKS